MLSRDHCLFGTVSCKTSNSVSVQVSELSLRDRGMLKNFKLSLLENASSLSILSSTSMKSYRVFAEDLAQYDLFLFERQSCTSSFVLGLPSLPVY